ncbi:expressed unknown protein [Seminavis robusta]|uniref:Uncharacterized protein n=1 Tax=Seminavis robusta TaxID=568900 RepID=A0A9N8H8B7_9STRA|nr:expressed unknown protein [Seminavis robusta]|eukprot:Sro87_g046120.1 n/a (536) ;mRNA; f:77326-79472
MKLVVSGMSCLEPGRFEGSWNQHNYLVRKDQFRAHQKPCCSIEGGDNRLLEFDVRQLLGEFPHLVEAFNLDDSRHRKNFRSFWSKFKIRQKQPKMSQQQPPPSPFFAAPGMNGAPMYGAPPSPAHYHMQPYAQSFQPQYGQIQPQYGQMVHQQPQLQRQFSQSQDPALELQWESLTTEKAYVDCYKHGSMVRKLWSTEEGPAALKTRIVNSGKTMALEGEQVTEMLQSCSSMRQSVLVLKRLGSSKVAEKQQQMEEKRQQMEAIRRELVEEERKLELVKKVDVNIPVAENHLYDAQRVMGQTRVSGNLRQPAANRSTASPFRHFAGSNHAENIDYAPEDTSSFSAPHPAVATGFQYVPAAAAPGFHQNAPPAASAARASAKRNLFGIPEHQEAAEQVETVESSGVKQGIFSNAPKPDMAASSGGFTTSNHVNGPETVNSPPAASAPPKGLFSGAPKPTPNQGGFAFPHSGGFNSNTSGGDSDFTVPPPIQSTATGQYLFGGFNTSPLKGGFNFGSDKDDEKKEAAYKPNKRTRLG